MPTKVKAESDGSKFLEERQMLGRLYHRNLIGSWYRNGRNEFVVNYKGEKLFVLPAEVEEFYRKAMKSK